LPADFAIISVVMVRYDKAGRYIFLVWVRAPRLCREQTVSRRVIAKVKPAAVSTLDPALPSIAFEHWLRTEAGAGARHEWEVNRGGEQARAPKAKSC
jgi:hypothetical protein